VCDDVTANRLLGVWVVHARRAAVDLRDDLVRDDDGDAELVGEALQRAHELGQVGLARRQLAAANEVGAVERRGRVDDEQREARLRHHLRRLVQEAELVVRVVGARVGDVVEDFFTGEAEAVGDREEADGPGGMRNGRIMVNGVLPECALSVDVQTLSLASAHVEWQLARHGQGVAYLALAGSELPEYLRDGASLDSACEECIELLRASRDGYQFASSLVHFRRCRESHRHELLH